MSAPEIPAGFDFTDPDVYVERLPMTEFAEVRRAAPIWWNEQPLDTGGFGDGGYWVVSKHADVRAVSRRNDVFSAAEKCVVPRYRQESAAAHIEAGRFSMINMDDPQHGRLRRIVSRGFTPRAVEQLRQALGQRAQGIAAEARARGTGDFVTDVAAELPLQAIAGLLGVPDDDRPRLFRWTNELVGDDDPEYEHVDPLQPAVELIMYATALAEGKESSPGDDIVTALINADVDGQRLTNDEFGLFVLTLAVGGSETSRNSITHGMKAFIDNPDQWELFKARRPKTAVDEILRWATPITAFQRTAVEDVELGGVRITPGQRVVMFYRSANFDEEVFEDPLRFNILRDPNPHVSFGGSGAHYCLGASLARMTIGLMFDAIAEHLPDLAELGRPERLRSGWLNGIKHWQVDYAGTS